MKFRGKEYDLTTVEGVDKISDLIDESQVNDCRSIAYALMQQPTIQVCDKEQQYEQALEAIKKNIEYSLKDKCEYSADWQIASRALNESKSTHTEDAE